MKRVFIGILFVCLCFQGFAQEKGEYSSRLSRDTILIGDHVNWIFDINLAEGEEFFLQTPEDEPVAGVETIEKLKFDTLSVKKGVAKIEGRSVITSFDSGSFFLPQLIAMIQRPDGKVDTLFIDGPTLEVTLPPVDTASFELNDIKEQIRYPLTFKEALPWIGLALLLAALIWAVFRFIKMRKENVSFFGKPVIQDPPHIVALRNLEKTRAQKLWQNGKQKQFYTSVTDTLRQYISDRYDISAMEETTGEIFDELEGRDINEALLGKVKDLFTTADYVKFAKHMASAEENENAIPTAIRFVNETYMQQIETEKKEEA